MAQTYKRLGAVAPSVANNQVNVYVVPAATESVISTISICNQGTQNASYSLIMMPASAFSNPANSTHFIVRGAVVPPADTIFLTLGITANAGSIVAANTNNNQVSFAMFGSEIS